MSTHMTNTLLRFLYSLCFKGKVLSERKPLSLFVWFTLIKSSNYSNSDSKLFSSSKIISGVIAYHSNGPMNDSLVDENCDYCTYPHVFLNSATYTLLLNLDGFSAYSSSVKASHEGQIHTAPNGCQLVVCRCIKVHCMKMTADCAEELPRNVMHIGSSEANPLGYNAFLCKAFLDGNLQCQLSCKHISHDLIYSVKMRHHTLCCDVHIMLTL